MVTLKLTSERKTNVTQRQKLRDWHPVTLVRTPLTFNSRHLEGKNCWN